MADPTFTFVGDPNELDDSPIEAIADLLLAVAYREIEPQNAKVVQGSLLQISRITTTKNKRPSR